MRNALMSHKQSPNIMKVVNQSTQEYSDEVKNLLKNYSKLKPL